MCDKEIYIGMCDKYYEIKVGYSVCYYHRHFSLEDNGEDFAVKAVKWAEELYRKCELD